MRVQVSCAILVYNEKTYHNGDYFEIESDSERQTLMRERCVVIEKAITEPAEKPHYIPSGDAIEELLSPVDKKKGRGRK